MELRDPGGAAQQELLPVVRYANRRRIDGGAPDYWDHATRSSSPSSRATATTRSTAAEAALAVGARAVGAGERPRNNLALIREARAEHGETVDWADELESELTKAARG